MDKSAALESLSALSQDMRLDLFRLLVRAGPTGMCVGEITDVLGARQNTVSTNLAILTRVGLTRSEREGRSIRYFARLDRMAELLSFLMEDCCGGRPEACAPLLDAFACAE